MDCVDIWSPEASKSRSLIPTSVTEYRSLTHLHALKVEHVQSWAHSYQKNDNLQFSTKFHFLGWLSQKSEEVLESQVSRSHITNTEKHPNGPRIHVVLFTPMFITDIQDAIIFSITNTATSYSQMSWFSSLPQCLVGGGFFFNDSIRNHRLYLCIIALHPSWGPLLWSLLLSLELSLTPNSKFKLWAKHTQHLALSKM